MKALLVIATALITLQSQAQTAMYKFAPPPLSNWTWRPVLLQSPERDAYRAIAKVVRNELSAPAECSGSVIDVGLPKNAKALFLTAGHCLAPSRADVFLPPGTYLADSPVPRSTLAYFYLGKTQPVPFTHYQLESIVYASMDAVDIAVVKLNVTYSELEARGIHALKLGDETAQLQEPITIAGYPMQADDSSPFLVSACAISQFGRMRNLTNGLAYNWIHIAASYCRTAEGDSGAPELNMKNEIIGLLGAGDAASQTSAFHDLTGPSNLRECFDSAGLLTENAKCLLTELKQQLTPYEALVNPTTK